MVCAFEADDLCGWKVDESVSVTWHRHSAQDEDILTRKNGARFDHTYGASKHIGKNMHSNYVSVNNQLKNLLQQLLHK